MVPVGTNNLPTVRFALPVADITRVSLSTISSSALRDLSQFWRCHRLNDPTCKFEKLSRRAECPVLQRDDTDWRCGHGKVYWQHFQSDTGGLKCRNVLPRTPRYWPRAARFALRSTFGGRDSRLIAQPTSPALATVRFAANSSHSKFSHRQAPQARKTLRN